jgi:hypothetical protein
VAGNGDIARHWQALRDGGEVQFAPLPPEPAPDRSRWMEWLGRLLGHAFDWLGRLLRPLFEPLGHALGLGWPVMRVLLVVAAVLLALALAWRAWRLRRRRDARPMTEQGWRPDAAQVRALLADADRLAAEGNYDEAVHVLLARSVERIAAERPGLLQPASTAREIAATSALPAAARLAFAAMAERVEASRFALRRLAEADWLAARRAYAEFALEGKP